MFLFWIAMEKRNFDAFLSKIENLEKWTETLHKNRLCLPKELIYALKKQGIEIDD